MPRAWNALRHSAVCKRELFDAGLIAAGFDLVPSIARPQRGDLMLSWNRYAGAHESAQAFEAAGATVLIVENGHLGKTWNGDQWFSIARGHHAGAGSWPEGGSDRWDSLGVQLAPWRRAGRETIILGQRGYGEPGVAAPAGWAEIARGRFGGRIRKHPGLDKAAAAPLSTDLSDAAQVVTWNSGAALQALILGVPVFYEFDRWIGARASLPISVWGAPAKRDDDDRLAMFRRLAWAMWRESEILSGDAIRAITA